MDEYTFDDALTGTSITCGFPQMIARVDPGRGVQRAESIFFPGCSFINYMTPLVRSVTDLLMQAGEVQGVSLLCCGKILEYEPNAATIRSAFEADLRAHILAAGVKRIVAACPNCVYALRALLDADEATADVRVVPLPRVLVDLGYRIDPNVARRMVADAHRARPYGADVSAAVTTPADRGDAASAGSGVRISSAERADQLDADRLPVFVVHDSCPDRDTGEFADATRAIMGEAPVADQEHCRSKSLCCGSRARAVGKFDAAAKLARKNGAESVDAGGDAIVVPCVSCAFLLSALQKDLPVFHYLELLYDWRIDWESAEQYMKLRFLFDVEDAAKAPAESGRAFMGIDGTGERS